MVSLYSSSRHDMEVPSRENVTSSEDFNRHYFSSSDDALPQPPNNVLDDSQIRFQQQRTGCCIKLLLATHWICALLFFSLFTTIVVTVHPWKDPYAKSDVAQTFWALVWSSLTCSQILLVATLAQLQRSGYTLPIAVLYFQRLLGSFNLFWFLCGIKPLFWDTPENPAVVRLARILWITQAFFFLIPLFGFVLMCFCMPCFLILRHAMQRPNLNVTPTPDWILSKLEVKKYKDLLDYFGQQLGGGTNALKSPSPPDSDFNALRRPLRAPTDAAVRQLRVEKSCPICMTEFEGSEEVMVMPCDKRHFFHVDCVRQWLHGSQYCPICRANVVTLTSSGSSDAERGAAHNEDSSGVIINTEQV